MATIALYANKINNMSSVLSTVKTAVTELTGELSSVKTLCSQVNTSICDLSDVVRSISSATTLQEDKLEALETLGDNIDTFADEADRIDGEVADLMNKRKDDFYSKYYYLKPECEKTGWDKFCDGCKKVGDWCKENWEALCGIVIAIVIIVAVVVICVVTFGTAAAALAAIGIAAGIGALVGLAGQLISDIICLHITGKWESTVWDYVGAAFGGAVAGLATMVAGPAVACALDSAVSSLLSDSLNSLFTDQKKSFGQIIGNAAFNAGVGALSGFLLDKLTKKVTKTISKKLIAMDPNNANAKGKYRWITKLSGSSGYEASYKGALTRIRRGSYHKLTKKSIRNGVVTGLSGDFFKNILSGVIAGLGIHEKVGILVNSRIVYRNAFNIRICSFTQ